VEIELKGSEAIRAENANHFMLRDHALNNTVESDLFALRSTLYKLITGKAPYEDQSYESVENLFREGIFSDFDGLPLNDLIMGYWIKKFRSVKEMFKFGERAYNL
jgi:hypothetical protein